MKYNFVLFLSIILILLSFSAVNAAESSNMTDDTVLSLDVSLDKSTELLSENEESALIQNNTISDFNNVEYAINSTNLSTNFSPNIKYDNLNSYIKYDNLQYNNGISKTGNIDLIKTNTYTPIYSNNFGVNSVPTYYNLANYGYVSSVKNQNIGNCWAHSALASLESCILKATGVEYDLSEAYLSKLARDYLGTTDEGGNILMSAGYIAGWLGAVKENYASNDPINLINIQNIYIIPSDNFKNDVKNAILKYGAVSASYFDNDLYRSNNAKNYYCNSDRGTNHEIVIVGWDDNYNKNNFKYTPKGNGAWICKNSGGTGWGDKGYFYISYYDETLGKHNPSYTFILNDSTKYYKNYQYDIQATGITYNSEYNAYRNVFTSKGYEKLTAISSYFHKGTYTITVKGNNQVYTQTFKTNIDGYFTVTLKNHIQLNTGQKFEVIINNPYKFLYKCEGNKITKKLPTGASYVSKDGGKTWTDSVSTSNFVCCIKAFTTTSAKLTERYSLTSDGLIKYYGNSKPLTATFKTNDGASAKNVKITFKINGNTYTRTTDAKGVVSININLNSGGYEIPIYLNNNFKQIKVTVIINPTIVGNDITKYYKNGTQYSVTCYDSNGNLLKNSKVEFNVNGVFYYRTTDANGVATLKINLPSDNGKNATYRITATNELTRENCANNIIVQSILEASDLTKRYGKSDQFTVTLLNGEGKRYANQAITFNINGVYYTRTTDSNGVAHLNINLPVGSYVVTASYNGLNIAKKVIVNP